MEQKINNCFIDQGVIYEKKYFGYFFIVFGTISYWRLREQFIRLGEI